MEARTASSRSLPLVIAFSLAITVVACGKTEPPAGSDTSAAAPAAPDAAAAQGTPAATPADETAAAAIPTSWTPEAMEELLAPVALYPDPVLSQVLIASTNPQEVLDAGNWLLQNQGLKGKALTDAGTKVGFTPPVLALLQIPDTLDMMCRELDWTTELGSAFKADQAGVLDAVQRLRKQAESVGNLKTSPQMTVDNEMQDGKEVVVLKPAADGQVYVPQYDPVAVYAPPPATSVAPAPATTTTTTTTETTGHSTGALVTTGLLSFGAGLLVANLFDDDDYHHHNDYYYPSYGYGRMPYYPPYPYRPPYGGGYYPSNGYRPPAGYGGRYGNNYVNNGNVIINTGGNKNNYWNNRNASAAGRTTTYGSTRQASSPITAANPKRSDLNELNKRQPRPMPADAKRPSATATASNWKGQTSYAGAKTGAKAGGTTGGAAATQQARPAPKVQGSYGGASADRGKAQQGTYAGAQAGKAQQGTYAGAQAGKAQGAAAGGDRGYAQQNARPQTSPKPQQSAAMRPAQQSPQARPQGGGGGGKSSAMAGADRGAADRQASQRGKQSMPQGAKSKGGGGGGGGRSGGGKQGRR